MFRVTGTVRVKAPAVNVTVAVCAPAVRPAVLTVNLTGTVGAPGLRAPAVGATLSQTGPTPVSTEAVHVEVALLNRSVMSWNGGLLPVVVSNARVDGVAV